MPVRIAHGLTVDPQLVRRITGDRFGNIIVVMEDGVQHIVIPQQGETPDQTLARLNNQLGRG